MKFSVQSEKFKMKWQNLRNVYCGWLQEKRKQFRLLILSIIERRTDQLWHTVHLCLRHTQRNSMLLFSSKISSSSSSYAAKQAPQTVKEGNNHFHWIFGLEECCFWKVIYHLILFFFFASFRHVLWPLSLTHFWLLGIHWWTHTQKTTTVGSHLCCTVQVYVFSLLLLVNLHSFYLFIFSLQYFDTRRQGALGTNLIFENVLLLLVSCIVSCFPLLFKKKINDFHPTM